MMHEKKEKILKQELRWLNILMKLRHQVNHFVTALQQYVHSELSHVSWSKFLHSLKNKVWAHLALTVYLVKIKHASMMVC
jgi:gamma-tubulin complex component 6